MAVWGRPGPLPPTRWGQNPSQHPPPREMSPHNALGSDLPSWSPHPSHVSTGRRMTRDNFPSPEGRNFPVTQLEKKGPNFPTWGNFGGASGLFCFPDGYATGREHPPRARWFASGKKSPAGGQIYLFAWIQGLYFEERRGWGGIFSPPWGPRGPTVVMRLDGERCQPGFTVVGPCKG